MPSDSTQPPSSNQPRRPAQLFEALPSIKIITPPKGQYSPQVDERCFTYCSQSVAGRINRREPYCRSVCIRNVFLHEVQNVISFKRHSITDSKGHAKYPLPQEGQPSPPDPDSEEEPKPTRYWQPGHYIWYTKDTASARRKFETMRIPLHQQEDFVKYEAKRRETWNAYQEYLKKLGYPKGKDGTRAPTAHAILNKDKLEVVEKSSPSPLQPDKFWHPPPRPLPDNPDQSSLSRLELPFPALYQSLVNLLTPSQKLLTQFKQSEVSGDQRQFWGRVWDKAFTKEPFVLANRTINWSLEKWKEGPPESESNP